jgi:NodT family efflux transporter outer membrane factor (OMF) lipoprotein
VGPDYVRPDVGAPATWHAPLQGGVTAGAPDPESLAKWWAVLGDSELSSLVERAAAGNLDLRAARARVREARARRGTALAGLSPTVNASGSASRSRSSENAGSGRIGELYSAGFDAGWELDLFGGVRRSVEASQADLEASQEDLRDVLVSLLAEVALNYVDARTYQARLAEAQDNLQLQEETLRLAQARREAGLTDALPLEQARYNLESNRAQIPALRTALEGALNQLAVLLGESPGALHGELEDRKAIPVPPLEVAVGVPAEALRRRPDVRRAERQLAAQTARIGVATADLYPKFSLSGSIGLEALASGDLLRFASRTWSLGPRITWPLFDAGAIRQDIEAQSAVQEQVLIAYESAVLGALQEVENALVAYAQEQQRRAALDEATAAAQRAVDLSRSKFSAGLADFLVVLDAERSLFSLQDQLAQSGGAVTSDLIRLYKALGGGWKALVPEG